MGLALTCIQLCCRSDALNKKKPATNNYDVRSGLSGSLKKDGKVPSKGVRQFECVHTTEKYFLLHGRQETIV
jgi:hypothetical protein